MKNIFPVTLLILSVLHNPLILAGDGGAAEEYFLCKTDKKDAPANMPPLAMRWRVNEGGNLSGNVLNMLSVTGKIKGDKGEGVAVFLLEKDFPEGADSQPDLPFNYKRDGDKFALVPKDPNSTKGTLHCQKTTYDLFQPAEKEIENLLSFVLKMQSSPKIHGCKGALEILGEVAATYYKKNKKWVPDVKTLLKLSNFSEGEIKNLGLACGKIKVEPWEKAVKGRLLIHGYPPLSTFPNCSLAAVIDRDKFKEVVIDVACKQQESP